MCTCRTPFDRGRSSGERPIGGLVYSATVRCPCGSGLAYSEDADPFRGAWDCAEILLGTASTEVTHTARLPFVYYEIKSEAQPSASGASTRPKE